MKSCRNCRGRDACASVCPEVEKRLPKDDTGRDARREICLDTGDFLAVAERYSFGGWCLSEATSEGKNLDLSVLSSKERAAMRLLASGLSQRESARRLKINLKSFQERVSKGRMKLLPRHFSHLVETEKQGRSGRRKGGGG